MTYTKECIRAGSFFPFVYWFCSIVCLFLYFLLLRESEINIFDEAWPVSESGHRSTEE